MEDDQLQPPKAAHIRAARRTSPSTPPIQGGVDGAPRKPVRVVPFPAPAPEAVVPLREVVLALPDVISSSPPAPVAEPVVATSAQDPSKSSPTQPPKLAEQPEPTPRSSTTGGLWVQLRKVRWVLALASLGAAMLAQNMAIQERVANSGQGAPPLLSWILFGVAAILFAIAVPASPAPATSQGIPFFATLRTMRRQRLFLALAGAAVLCAIVATPLFFALNSTPDNTVADWPINTGSWLLYIAAVLLLAGAWTVWERNTQSAKQSTTDRPSTTDHQHPETLLVVGRRSSVVGRQPMLFRRRRVLEWAVVMALFVLALLLRVPNLDSAPPGFWFDEAQNGIVARGLLAPGAAHPTFIADFTQMGAFFFYILGALLKLLGETSIWPIRLVPALAGSLLVVMLYFIASRLYGWRVGVAAAALLAVSSWNITFSRFGLASLPTVAIDVAVYLCLIQALRTGRLGYYAAGGVLLGFALQMYYAAELVPVVLGLVFLHRLITERMRFWRSVRAGIAVLAVGAIIGFLPVATFVIQQPAVFTARAGTVNIFSPEGSDNNPNALGISLNKHALMFNYAGDGNGRHNLPGDPMLDWWTGALFIAGLGVCLLRIRRWHYFYPLVWFLVALSGGVLSVVFEAPQAHRTLENSVVTALIAGIFLGELSDALTPRIRIAARTIRQRPFAALAAGASLILLVAVLVLAGADNIDHYFNHQLNTQGVWLDMLGQDRAIADDLVQYGPTHQIYVSDSKANYAPSTYHAPNVSMIPWSGMAAFPLIDAKDTELLLTGIDSTDVVSIKRAYPHAKVDVLYGPNGTDPQLFQVDIPAGDISGLRGIHAAIFGKDPTKPPLDDTLQALQFDWGGQAAQAAQASNVRLSSTLKVEQFNIYSFRWAGPDGNPAPGSVLVDGFDVTSGSAITLAMGLHRVVVTSTVPSTPGTDQLLMGAGDGSSMNPIGAAVLFDPRKIEPHGLTVSFRQGTNYTSPVAFARVDSTVSFYFHNTPLGRPYTGEWQGKIYIPVAGPYTFHTEQISESQLAIDGQDLISNLTGNNMVDGKIQLTAGLHDIRLLFLDKDGDSHIYLYWTPPGMDGTYIIPSAFLLPVMASYPDQHESGPWPTLAQADDSVWVDSAEAGASSTGPGPAPVTGTVQPTAKAQQPPTQAAAPPTPAPTIAGQTVPKEIQPIIVIGQSDQALKGPKAAAVDSDSNMYIYSEGDTSISKFGPDGKRLVTWNVHEGDGKPATEISAIVVKDGKLLALDASTSELIHYNLDGTGGDRTSICSCFFARGMSIANDGNFWVTDTGGNRVLKVDPSGQVLATLDNGKGAGPGQFVEPAGVWQAPEDGTLYVTDVTNKRVQSFTSDLKPIAAWPMGQSTPRDGNRVAADDNGALVTEYDSKAVVRYDPQGKELSRWIYDSGLQQAIPAFITSAGNGKFLVLYPFANLAVLFSPGPG